MAYPYMESGPLAVIRHPLDVRLYCHFAHVCTVVDWVVMMIGLSPASGRWWVCISTGGCAMCKRIMCAGMTRTPAPVVGGASLRVSGVDRDEVTERLERFGDGLALRLRQRLLQAQERDGLIQLDQRGRDRHGLVVHFSRD